MSVWIKLLAASACIFLFQPNTLAGDVRPHAVVEFSYHTYTGTEGKSIKGATGYTMIFRSSDIKGFLRPHVAFEIGTSTGTASINTDTPSYTLYRASFLPGFHIYIIPAGNFQPFVGANGTVGWSFFQMDSPPTGIEGDTQGLFYGYEASAGVDIRFSKNKDSAIRISSSVLTNYAQVAGFTDFQLNSFRLALGYLF